MAKDDKRERPIGVFDSGLGGLTVVKELIKQLPHEHIVYFGDTARVPYGTKSKESIIHFSKQNTRVLLKQKVKCVVVACNSSSSYALDELTKGFSVPIIGVILPGAKEALQLTKNNRIGVISTSATVKSGAYKSSIQRFNRLAKVFHQPCPLFVPLVEEGWSNKSITRTVADEYLSRLKKDKVDTLILGCTHYPLLKNVLSRVMGKGVRLVDSAKVVAKEVKVILREKNLQRLNKGKAKYKFIINDKPQEFQRIARQFLGINIQLKVEKEHV